MSKEFVFLRLLPRDFTKNEITYNEAVLINKSGVVQVKKVSYEHYPGGKQTIDERETKTYDPTKPIAQNYLRSVLELKPELIDYLTGIFRSEPDILAAIKPLAINKDLEVDVTDKFLPPSEPSLVTQTSDDSEAMGTLGSQGSYAAPSSGASETELEG